MRFEKSRVVSNHFFIFLPLALSFFFVEMIPTGFFDPRIFSLESG